MIQRWVVDKWRCAVVPRWIEYPGTTFMVYVIEMLGSMIAQVEVCGPYNINEWQSLSACVRVVAVDRYQAMEQRMGLYDIMFDEGRCGPALIELDAWDLASTTVHRLTHPVPY